MKKFVFFLPVPRDAILCPCSACTLSVDGLVKCVDWRCSHQQPIGRALSTSPFESEDGSAATGQMVMRSFASFLYYVRPPKKNVLSSCSVRPALHVHRRAPLELCRFGPFELGAQLRTRCA